MAIVDEMTNESPSNQTSHDLRAELADALSTVTPDDVTIEVHQPKVRCVHITEVSAVLDSDYLDVHNEYRKDVQKRAKEFLGNYLAGKGTAGDARREIKHPGWEWSKSLHFNELVSELHDLDGIDRPVDAKVRHSDDLGSTWSKETTLDEVKAAADGNKDVKWGLLTWKSSEDTTGQTFTLKAVT